MIPFPLAAPAAEPLTLAAVKAHLALDTADDDAYLTGLIRTARDHLERSTGLMLITQRWRITLDSVCEDGVIHIPKGPLQSLDRLRFYDSSGDPVEVDVSGLAFERGTVPSRVWTGQAVRPGRAVNGIEVDFTGGFGATGNEVPDSILRALSLHVAQMFEYRGAVTLADQPALLPDGYDRLLAPFRQRRL